MKLSQDPISANSTAQRSKHTGLTVLTVLLAVVSLGSVYLQFAWNNYRHLAEEEAVQVGQLVGALLPINDIKNLVKGAREPEPQVGTVQQVLDRCVETAALIHYAYIQGVDQDSTILAHSKVTDAVAAHPPGVCEKETPDVFEWGEKQGNPTTLWCGSWVRTLIPLYDENGGPLAVLGLSYSLDRWQADLFRRLAPDTVMVVSFLVLALALVGLRFKHQELAEEGRSLSIQEALYRGIFEQAPIGVALVDHSEGAVHRKVQSINPAGEAILGRDIEELYAVPWAELTHPEDLIRELGFLKRFIMGEINAYFIEKRILKPDGTPVWVNARVVDYLGRLGENSTYLCLFEDISERKGAEAALRESERSKSAFLAHIPGMAYVCKYDWDWTMEYVSDGCRALTGYESEELIENREISYREVISPEYRDRVWDGWRKALARRNGFHDEYEIVTKTGERKWVLEHGQGIFNTDGSVKALEGIVLDISEQKQSELQIARLKERDFFTGLYNRNHMELEKRRLDDPEHLPFSIVICDIDGLGMVNDAYGYQEGDRLITQAAELIQSVCRPRYLLGRTSGGEFMVLMPNQGEHAARRFADRLEEAVQDFNSEEKLPFDISLSTGTGTKSSPEQLIEEVETTAKDNLRRKKLLNQKSSHHAIVSSILATLYAKSQETEQHGQRLGEYCLMIGEHLSLEQQVLDDLELLAKLHDIGKIGVDDSILNKPGRLTEADWVEMKRHPEIGHRIAMSTPQLEHIAKYILYHHERWDGTGYPAGLKGTDIPLVSRILAVADAYDAMTEDRVYRKALSKEQALEELITNAGTQFDPHIVKVFIELVNGQSGSVGGVEPFEDA